MQPMRWERGFFFYNALPHTRYDATGHLLLALEAPLLSTADAAWSPAERAAAEAQAAARSTSPRPSFEETLSARPILLLDSTWRRLPRVASCVVGDPILRSLPSHLKTAYPRVNQEGEDPPPGLATIEALYVALRLLGHDCPETLAHYPWKEVFLEENYGGA